MNKTNRRLESNGLQEEKRLQTEEKVVKSAGDGFYEALIIDLLLLMLYVFGLGVVALIDYFL